MDDTDVYTLRVYFEGGSTEEKNLKGAIRSLRRAIGDLSLESIES